MAVAHKADLERLEARVNDLDRTLAKLGDRTELAEFLKLLHRPGWTTPAEFLFASTIVNAMNAHANALTTMRRELLKAGAEVGGA